MRRKIKNNVKGIIADNFAYKPTASRGGMMKSSDEPTGEEISEEELDESVLRELIRAELERVYRPS
jgi:hypothetical protein